MDASAALSVIFPILTVVVGGACILLFGITSTLRTSNGDLRARVTDLEASETRLEALCTSQATEILALQKVVTGEVQLAALADVLDAHHKETVISAARIEKSVDTILEKVTAA